MSEPRHILIVDDDPDIVELLAYNLKKGGYRTSVARTGRAALDLALSGSPDLILLDLMLPELSGTEVANRLRTSPVTSEIPIVMLTAKGEETDQIVGLTVGADDYVTKPFAVKVLLARIEAVLRRAARPTGSSRVLRLGGIEINAETYEVNIDHALVKFTLTEFRLLTALVQAGGRIQSRSTLMTRAMGPGVTVTERTIDVHMTSIRKKLGSHQGLIKTVRGVGYRATVDPAGEGEEQVGTQ
ncbi:MAG: response regulator [Planctomycetota bacterium]